MSEAFRRASDRTVAFKLTGFKLCFEFLNNVSEKIKKVPGQYVRNKTHHAEIIFLSFTLQQKRKEGSFPLWRSQAHPLLIMRVYKDSIKALNLLLNTERRMIPGVSVVNHTPACTMRSAAQLVTTQM